jgi:hypothetical protein
VAIPLALFGVALAARLLLALVFSDAAYPDAFYYAQLARSMAAGNGLSIDYIWNFVEVGGRLPAVPVLPVPSNAHWMPLGSVIQVPFILILGATGLASGLPFWLIGSLAAPLTYWIARDAGLESWLAIGAGLMVAVPAGMMPFVMQPDNFAPYMVLGALALWACARGLSGDRRAFVLGGLAVGFASLFRSDGILLGVPFAIVFAAERIRGLRGSGRGLGDRLFRPGPIGWRAALGSAGLFLLVMGPWWIRQWLTFGAISPSATSGRILWIRDYNELWSVTTPTTLQSFLDQPLGELLLSRASGLASALAIYAEVPLLIFLVPVVLIGILMRWRDHAFVPVLIYAVTLFAFNGLLFALHVPYGTFLHSAAALVPHSYVLAVIGIGGAVVWIARWRPRWNVQRATRNFTAIFVACAIVFGMVGAVKAMTSWKTDLVIRSELTQALRSAPAGDRVMSADPGGIAYVSGRGGIVSPFDPLPVVEDALRGYGIRWLVLERAHIVPSLWPLFIGEQRPAWLSKPVASVGLVPATEQTPESPAAILFAVCFEPDDDRCAP